MSWDDWKIMARLFGPLIIGFIIMLLLVWLAVSMQDSITLCWYSDAECLDRIGWVE